MFSELGRLIEQVSKDKGIEKKIVQDAVVQGLLTAARKKYGTYRDIEVKYNEETGEMDLFEFKTVVKDEDFIDDQIEIKFSEAVKLDPEARENDQIGIKMETEDLGRIDAYSARQIISQNLRNAEHEMIFNEFEKRKGEVVGGIVRRIERGAVVVDLEKTEAYIPRREQIPGERYKPGDRIQGYILEVEQAVRGPQIIMSRACPDYLIKLFETEVPEIYEGIVKIKKAARDAGQRAKMAVYSLDSAVHPVGACVGMKGTRVQNITQELKGERIDVVIWDSNPVQFVCNALAPAKIAKVFVDEENQSMEVIVPDDQLSLAIGKRGQNVRLAVQLTEWKLDIMSEQDYENKKREALFNLTLLSDINETQAQNLFQSGVYSVQQLQDLSIEKLKSIPGWESEEKAQALILSAKNLVEEYRKQNKEFEKAPTIEEEALEKKQLGAKEQADLRLKREMEHLKTPAGQEADTKDSEQEGRPSTKDQSAEENQPEQESRPSAESQPKAENGPEEKTPSPSDNQQTKQDLSAQTSGQSVKNPKDAQESFKTSEDLSSSPVQAERKDLAKDQDIPKSSEDLSSSGGPDSKKKENQKAGEAPDHVSSQKE